jgi:S1-C subfamily serine protease
MRYLTIQKSSLKYSLPGSLAAIFVFVLGAQVALAAGGAPGLLRALSPDFLLRGSQGYLGVDLQNVDPARAKTLNLKNGHGVEILVVDHDAPAAKAGLKTHDVIVAMNGHTVENRDQLHRLLHKQPAGRNVAFTINRDGSTLNITVELANREALQQQAWSQHYSVENSPDLSNGDAASFVPAPSRGSSSFLGALMPNSLYVGVDLSPVHSQLAEYFGVTNGIGLLVESVDNGSPAARAGLRAGDIVLKVNDHPMVNRNDWQKVIHNSRGQWVQLTIVRNKQQQLLTMTAGQPKKKG